MRLYIFPMAIFSPQITKPLSRIPAVQSSASLRPQSSSSKSTNLDLCLHWSIYLSAFIHLDSSWTKLKFKLEMFHDSCTRTAQVNQFLSCFLPDLDLMIDVGNGGDSGDGDLTVLTECWRSWVTWRLAVASPSSPVILLKLLSELLSFLRRPRAERPKVWKCRKSMVPTT